MSDADQAKYWARMRGGPRSIEELISVALEVPSLGEGFDELHYVKQGDNGGFVIEEWNDEVR